MASDETHLARKLAVVLHADVVGSTELVRRNETIAHDRIQNCFARLSETVQAYGGVVHELRGDALLAEFSRASDAVSAALAFQAGNLEHNTALEDDIQPEVRIGITLGEVVISDGTLTGPDVVLAQRLEQLAPPGGVCISQAANQSIPERLPFDYEDLGEQPLKGFDKAVHAYSIVLRPGETIPAPEPDTTTGKTGPVQQKQVWAISGVIALLLVVASLFWIKPWAPQWKLPDKPSIVVLPFTNMSDESEEEHFADGMTDDLITDLSRISGLFVIARNTSFTYKGAPVNIPAIAEELGVRYVLEGSVRRAGGKLRINAQLIDASTGGHLWAERYDSDSKDVFSLQNQVIGRIATALEVTLTDSEKSQLERIPTRNLEAYDYFQRAKRKFYLWGSDNKRMALSLYQKALELDPEFAEAYAGVASIASRVWRWGMAGVLPGPVARQLAFSAASKALALDPNNGEAYSVLGWSQLVEGEYEQAIATARRAVSMQSSPDIYAQLAGVLGYSGRHAEALTVMEQALRQEPKPPPTFHGMLGWVLFWNGQYEEAIESLEKAREGGVEYFPFLAASYAELNRHDEAKAIVKKIRDHFPTVSLAWVQSAYTYYQRPEDLEHHLNALRKAGVPEWPFGFQGREEDRLNGSAIAALIYDQTWVGHDIENRGPVVQEFDKNGNVVVKGMGSLLVGTATVEGEMLCFQIPARNLGRKQCSYLFRNPEGTPENQNEYVMATDTMILNFSVKP
ncbi:MAG: adenylate/guanylate cyclase domain-containing protein [Arenicellales bacterium]|nr:adenylate/guanylate cyclase domain-containing protein [Arenicellales bacterium]